ncbi:MAG: hypothetical protein CVT59_05360 [Actinobacteria bacterium HGW-Actinobacteria-1]|jgi:4-amino-4-deoxy-L-arabinose transferase-like glycosyltransferase|nr:MAG: hypothetical protein CVT59_05360 [Actinobacteria bacterium HGW-Actinobacteria-1]
MKQTENRRKLVMLLALAAILIVAFALRVHRIADPIGGFHAFNEGFYTKIAAGDMHRGAFDWLISPADRLNPPLYSLVVTGLFLVFGQSVALARLVSVAAGVATVYYTFLLGRTLYTERIGLLAAAVLAVTPGFALVNHNIQVDSLMVFFIIAGTYHYIHAIPSDDRREALVGGALMGLALATKLPAAVAPVVLALWETWRTRGVKWVRAKRVLPFTGGMFALGLPWYITRLVIDGSSYLSGQAALSGNAASVDSWITFRYKVLNELLWMLSPVLAALAIAAIIYLLRKRSSGDRLVLLSVGAYVGFYLVYNFHSYYLIPLAPFVALAVARAAFALERRIPRTLWAAAVVLPYLLVATMMMFAGQKYGLWSPSQVAETIPARAGITVYDTSEIGGSYQPAIDYALAPATVVPLPEGFDPARDIADARPGEAYILTSLTLTSDTGVTVDPIAAYSEHFTSIRLFGFELEQVAPNRHFFGNGVWHVEWRGAPYFGSSVRESDTYIRLYDAKAFRDFLTE